MSDSEKKLGVVVVAAGSSSRMGGVDKQLADLRGRPVLMHSLDVFEDSSLVTHIAVVFSTENIEPGRAEIEKAGLKKVVSIIVGGARRQDSARVGINALLAAAPDTRLIAVHDGARPFVDVEMLERGIAAARVTGAAVPAVGLKDTIKEVDENGLVTGTRDRSRLRAAQTPQIFSAAVLVEAHEAISEDVTDDAAMVERHGGKVAVFDGDYDNIKITTAGDLVLAEAIYDRRTGQPGDAGVRRWGTGFDGHRLVAGGPLRLGGVDVPFGDHLEGHSDGDVLLHALTSAVLGAASLGDIGTRFPSSDPNLAGVDSAEFLKNALALAGQAGWLPEHLDATIIAQRPRLAGHTGAMRERIAGIAGISPGAVNIKVTSTDHVGAIGRGDGIAAQAVATLARSPV